MFLSNILFFIPIHPQPPLWQYYRGAAAAIIVYDITNPDSFAGAKSWVKELQRRGDQNVVIALVCSLLISLQVIFI